MVANFKFVLSNSNLGGSWKVGRDIRVPQSPVGERPPRTILWRGPLPNGTAAIDILHKGEIPAGERRGTTPTFLLFATLATEVSPWAAVPTTQCVNQGRAAWCAT